MDQRQHSLAGNVVRKIIVGVRLPRFGALHNKNPCRFWVYAEFRREIIFVQLNFQLVPLLGVEHHIYKEVYCRPRSVIFDLQITLIHAFLHPGGQIPEPGGVGPNASVGIFVPAVRAYAVQNPRIGRGKPNFYGILGGGKPT